MNSSFPSLRLRDNPSKGFSKQVFKKKKKKKKKKKNIPREKKLKKKLNDFQKKYNLEKK